MTEHTKVAERIRENKVLFSLVITHQCERNMDFTHRNQFWFLGKVSKLGTFQGKEHTTAEVKLPVLTTSHLQHLLASAAINVRIWDGNSA